MSSPVAVLHDAAGTEHKGQKTKANSIPVTLASDEDTLTVTEENGSTGTLSNVSASATSVQLKASNTSRKFIVIYNDSQSDLRVKYGSSASATSFTHHLRRYEQVVIDGYDGEISGIWDSAVGNARVTEVT